jgi:Ca2+-dependent lipid-binding protein
MDEGVISWVVQIISKELKQKEFQEEVLRPLVKSLISYILPYLFFIIAMNLFLIILAFTIVMYFIPKR